MHICETKAMGSATRSSVSPPPNRQVNSAADSAEYRESSQTVRGVLPRPIASNASSGSISPEETAREMLLRRSITSRSTLRTLTERERVTVRPSEEAVTSTLVGIAVT